MNHNHANSARNSEALNAIGAEAKTRSSPLCKKDGGAEGSRTPDLLIANETLYQLSYDPTTQKDGPKVTVTDGKANLFEQRDLLSSDNETTGADAARHLPHVNDK